MFLVISGRRHCVLSETCRNLSNFDFRKFVFRPELRFGAVGDFNASAKEVPGRGTWLVLVLGCGELGSLACFGRMLIVGDDRALFFFLAGWGVVI